MRARNLKHIIIFQEQSTITNKFNEKEDKYIDILTCRASIQTISGKETFLSSSEFSTLSHKLRVRYSPLVNTKQTIKYDDRTFNILSVLNIFEANKELEILCEEVISD